MRPQNQCEAQGRVKPLMLGLIGNVLDHYDTALYGFLAPFIAPIIFPESSFITALIKTYGLMSLSIITRPMGAWFFGRFGMQHGARASLSLSLSGMACVTFAMGILPSFAQVGELAPFVLALLRFAQGFFGAGETTIAPFFILYSGSPKRRGLIDSFYGGTTVLGEILASGAAVLVAISSAPEFYWRLPFMLSAVTALVSVYLRLYMQDLSVEQNRKQSHQSYALWADLKRYWPDFLRVIAVSGMSYITYSVPFVFLNTFIPQISSISYAEMMKLNTWFLLFDMLVLPLFGYLSDRISPTRLMTIMSALLALLVLPLFLLLENPSMMAVSFVRIVIVLIGLGFCAPLHVWFMTQFGAKPSYVLVGLGYAIGSQVLGRSAPFICLFLYNQTQMIMAPALYVMFVAVLACGSLMRSLAHEFVRTRSESAE